MRDFNAREYLLSGNWMEELDAAPPIEEDEPVCSCTLRFPDAPVIRTAFEIGDRYGLVDDEGTLRLPPKDHPFWAILDAELENDDG